MLRYFQPADSSGVITQVEIDKDYIIKLFHGSDMLWSHISAVSSVTFTRNRFGTFFIVKLHCGSGGFCEEFYLIGFNGDRPTPPVEVGANMGDEGFEQIIDHQFLGDSALLVRTKEYDESEKLKDSSVVRYPLRIEGDSLVAPH